MCILLLCELERQQDTVVSAGGVAANALKARAQAIYDTYSSLDGNGHGTQVNAYIQSAPLAKHM